MSWNRAAASGTRRRRSSRRAGSRATPRSSRARTRARCSASPAWRQRSTRRQSAFRYQVHGARRRIARVGATRSRSGRRRLSTMTTTSTTPDAITGSQPAVAPRDPALRTGAQILCEALSGRASTRSSASRAARSCPSITRCPSTPTSSTTSSAGTSRAPATRPRATRARADAWACASRRADRARRTSSRRSPTRGWTSTPMVALTGQVPSALPRHRRVPGDRHHRDHRPDHEAQLPRARPARHPARDRRGVPHREHGTSGTGRSST